MSHVDEGRLHAWLDGAYEEPALAAEGREVASHLATCASCRAALEREREVRERAAGVLRSASPEVGAPAWDDVLARRERVPAAEPIRRRRGFPVAWAASIVLAVGAGWIASRELMQDAGPVMQAESGAQAESDAMAAPLPSAPSAGADEVQLSTDAPGRTDGRARAAADAAGRPESQARVGADDDASSMRQQLRDAVEAERPRAVPFALERREAAAPRLADAQGKAMGEVDLALVTVPGAELLRDYDRAVLDDAWQDATSAEAEAVLGRAPAVLEGAAIESVQVAESEQGRAVRVVQRLDPFTLLELVQRQEPESDAVLLRGANLAEAPSPDSLFVLAPDPDRGAAVVALRRGDITLLLRAPVATDSLRVLAARVRE